jgi:hypothetical protein
MNKLFSVDLTKTCPGCEGPMPHYPGALSRRDNLTEVCPECGSREAGYQHAAGSYDDMPGFKVLQRPRAPCDAFSQGQRAGAVARYHDAIEDAGLCDGVAP